MRWLWHRMVAAYVLCPVVTAVIVAIGRGHRLAALVLLFTVVVGTHVYVVVCALSALVLAPRGRPGVTGRFWDDTPIVGLLALPVLIALGRFADEPTQTAGMAAVGVVLVAMLIRGYRNGFEPPKTKPDNEDGADEHRD